MAEPSQEPAEVAEAAQEPTTETPTAQQLAEELRRENALLKQQLAVLRTAGQAQAPAEVAELAIDPLAETPIEAPPVTPSQGRPRPPRRRLSSSSSLVSFTPSSGTGVVSKSLCEMWGMSPSTSQETTASWRDHHILKKFGGVAPALKASFDKAAQDH